MAKISIIWIYHAVGQHKADLAKFCFERLLWTISKDTEIIVVNNCDKDIEYYKEKADIYIQSPRNSLGGARNLGYAKASGDYIAFVDSDVFTMPDWLRMCVRLINMHPDHKLIASPVYTDSHVWNRRYQAGKLSGHMLNLRSGSPCFVLQRRDMDVIGAFREGDGNSGDGGDFIDRQIKAGYKVILTKRQLAFHLGSKKML
ncbi:MAG TPA: glycosyltransferase family 2 protein [bacterium]|nr:glycosyltransferase family 2 protein [bacterium]